MEKMKIVKSIKQISKEDIIKAILDHEMRLKRVEVFHEKFCEKCVDRRTCEKYKKRAELTRYIG
jgi:hypothetical protein